VEDCNEALSFHSIGRHFFRYTAQSGEESILVASLRGVIAKQAAEIEALQSKLKELTATSAAAAGTAASEISQSTAKFAEVCFVILWRVKPR
jgi:hypothetical protein